jgi:hypothetical protein
MTISTKTTCSAAKKLGQKSLFSSWRLPTVIVTVHTRIQGGKPVARRQMTTIEALKLKSVFDLK